VALPSLPFGWVRASLVMVTVVMMIRVVLVLVCDVCIEL